MARVSCVCDPNKSHLPSGTALICPGGGGHVCCTRCAPHGHCPLHPMHKLTPIKLHSAPLCSGVHIPSTSTVSYKDHRISLSALENELQNNPGLFAPRGTHGPIIDLSSRLRCDQLSLAKTSIFPECAIVTFTQNIPIGAGSVFKIMVIGTIWPGETRVQLWPRQRLSDALYISTDPFVISSVELAPVFTDDPDGDVFGLPSCTIRTALQHPCVWLRMPWLNKGQFHPEPSITTEQYVYKVPRQQPRANNGSCIMVNGRVEYTRLSDNADDYLCPLCGSMQTKHEFFSGGCGVGVCNIPT